MPIYEYNCASCGHVTEALRSMAQADEPIACESCGHTQTRRAHSVFAAGKSGREMSLPMGGGGGGGGCGRCGDPNGPCSM